MRHILFFTVLGAFCLLAGCGNRDSAVSSHGRSGGYVPFTLQNLAGETVTSESLLGQHKAVLVNFWATWCPPCQEEIPDLIRLQERHGSEAFTVVGMYVGESQRRVKAFVYK